MTALDILIQYLRGRLDVAALQSLRSFGGLQAYPSRRKNPEIVNLSTGSMGLGAVQATFGALACRRSSRRPARRRRPRCPPLWTSATRASFPHRKRSGGSSPRLAACRSPTRSSPRRPTWP